MAKEPKANWSSFTKAELIRTIKALDKRQTQLLNRIAKLEAELTRAEDRTSPCISATTPQFPWDNGPRAGALPNPFETEPER